MAAAKVLVAVDPSEHATKAVEFYVERLHKPNNNVSLMYMVEMPESKGRHALLSQEEMSKEWKKQVAGSKDMERKLLAYLKRQGVTNAQMEVRSGSKVGPAIVETAEDEKFNLIVMGSRGLGAVKRAILGSVSDYVLNNAHCPVFICRS